jgi:glycosyltransferase involved in cell wall biosynthesis
MIKLGFIIPEAGHLTRGIGSYAKNLLAEYKKNSELIVEEIGSFDEVSEEMDLVHVPFFDLFFRTLPSGLKKPIVVTIHDVIPLVFPKYYPPGLKGKLRLQFQKYSLKNVDAVITDSECSKKDIAKYLNVPANKIYVTLLAASQDFKVIKDQKLLSRIKKQYQLPDKFALFTGSTNWNKNIAAIAQASLAADIDVVFIGKSFEERQNLEHLEMQSFRQFLAKYEFHPNIHILGFVPTEDLVPIVNLATVMMLPSHYEGFGLPILEAQACGVPVIAGNNSSMVEVAGDSALMVDSNNIHEITEAISEIVNDKVLKEKLINAGFKNIAHFGWGKCAAETINVYKNILK